MPQTRQPTDAAPEIQGRRRGPSKGDQKEAAILETAWRLLAEQPVSTITIDQLARGAGISRPTFYFYFDSREAVIRALAVDVAGQLHGILDEFTAMPQAGSAVRPILRATISRYLRRWETIGPVLRAMNPIYEHDPELRRFWDDISNDVVAAVASVIDTERSTGRAPAAPPSSTDLAHALIAMMWRTGYELSLDAPWTLTFDQAVDTLTTICARAIYGTDSPTAP